LLLLLLLELLLLALLKCLLLLLLESLACEPVHRAPKVSRVVSDAAPNHKIQAKPPKPRENKSNGAQKGP
jgi:hypothetical protein